MNWIYVMMKMLYQTSRGALKLVSFVGLKKKLANYIPNEGWNMADRDIEERNSLQAKHILKAFSDKISYLIFP